MKSAEGAVDWSRAYERYSPDVLKFLRHRLWSRQDLAEDLLQETFARAMNASTPVRDPSRIRAYLLQIANNLVIGQGRKFSKVDSESDLGPSVNLELHTDQKALDPLEASGVAQFQERVDRVVAQLPEDQQIAFERGVIERVPYAEIAREYSWSLSKVKSCVFRARKTLMDELVEFR